jgi:hypothetical protein
MDGRPVIFQRADHTLDKMQDPSSAEATLYERLLGKEWSRLPEIVRKVHLDASGKPRRGCFRVVRGQGRLAKALASILRLPPAGDATPIQLEIRSDGRGEQWLRTFGTRRLTTLQYEAPNGLLAERFGFLELRFRLIVFDNSLSYSQERVFLCVGRRRIPLPRWISPRVSATEAAVDARRTHVTVKVSAPYIGLIIAYEGELEIPSRSP